MNSADSKLTKYEKKFIDSSGCDKEFRRKLVDFTKKRGLNLIVLEPGVFDYGIKRFGKKKDGYVVVYDYDKTAEALAKDYMKTNKKLKKSPYSINDAYTDAYEWLDYNTVRSLPYMGANAPKLVYDDEDGKEQVV